MAQRVTPEALANFKAAPDEAFVKIALVQCLFACSAATVWRRVRDGKLPSPVKLSERSTAWRVGDLRAALASMSQ